MAGDPYPWNWPLGGWPIHYPTYQPPVYTTWTPPPASTACKWFEDKGNESYMYFTSCGAQIDQRQDWWKHCPKCGGLIEMPPEPPATGKFDER